MTRVELYAYVKENRNALIAEACKYLDEEDGVWAYYGDVALSIYYDEWDEAGEFYYKLAVYALNGDNEEAVDTWVWLGTIKTEI